MCPTMRRWRRATDGGEPVLQTVIARRNLTHLQSGPEVTPAMWPRPPPASTNHRPGAFRRHTLTGVIQENMPGVELASRNMADVGRVAELEDTVLALTDKLSSTTAAEQNLLEIVNQLRARLTAVEKSNETHVAALEAENSELRRTVQNMTADIERKSQLLEQVSTTFPAYMDTLSLQHLGPLQQHLSHHQVSTLLEMLCLGADPHELYLLMQGKSETGADIIPFLHLAGRMKRQFSNAAASSDAIQGLLEGDNAEGGLTREAAAKLLQEHGADALRDAGVDAGLVGDVSAALASGMDPWSIVTLLDGRILRSSTIDMHLATPLAGVLRQQKTVDKQMSEADILGILSKMAKKCSLSPMRVLRERNDELEAANIQLEAELGNMRHLLRLKQSNWRAESLGPRMPSDLWRVDSVGNSGVPSPSSPAPPSVGKVF